MKTLTNAEFMDILHKCCSDGKVDDAQLENALCTYFPYNLVFKGGFEKG